VGGSDCSTYASFGLRGPEYEDRLRYLLNELKARKEVWQIMCLARSGERIALMFQGNRERTWA